ncbi:hypothetical protein GOP47_0018397, partial [Adiantum capillus-veneris]
RIRIRDMAKADSPRQLYYAARQEVAASASSGRRLRADFWAAALLGLLALVIMPGNMQVAAQLEFT